MREMNVFKWIGEVPGEVKDRAERSSEAIGWFMSRLEEIVSLDGETLF